MEKEEPIEIKIDVYSDLHNTNPLYLAYIN